MTVEALTNREGKQASTATEKEETVWHECFLPHNDDQYYELPPAGSAHIHITEQAVEPPLFSQLVKMAPGADKLSCGAIRLL